MDKEQRNILRRSVEQARHLLETEISEQLEGTHNILPDGRVLDGAPGDPVVRDRLLQALEHFKARGATPRDAFDRLKREAAFTILNRFAALKLAESRGIVRQCISNGSDSEGIREFSDCVPGLRGAFGDAGYRLIVEAMMDELSVDLSVLFDRRSPTALLWPRPKALEHLLSILNDSQLSVMWQQDETIGWIYQYFNADDVKAMRDASPAPRNSHELAVRNQFFTPRYVVEFLTDNTLGRIWYEMRKGNTRLKEQCHFLIRRQAEIFLEAGQIRPPQQEKSDASEEDSLNEPSYIPHRPPRDPRTILLLDPACGSMHFGLYAFDLFFTMYEEAWEQEEADGTAALERDTGLLPLHETYTSRDAFVREVPKLIIERNLHGIDIDPRATQIASLALWLRVQRAWQEQGVSAVDRPRVERTNIVCAEPMPGETALLQDFINRHLAPTSERQLLGELVRRAFEAMRLAGEAGSLLNIEEEIESAVAEAKARWLSSPAPEQGRLFGDAKVSTAQPLLPLDVSGITDEAFWGRAEERIYSALQAYAEQAESRVGFQRRLFTNDAARGFSFINICRKRYDVVLMNPPFGEATGAGKTVLREHYGPAKTDLAMAFVSMGLRRMVEHGLQGAITTRAFVGNEKLKKWRHEALLGSRGALTIFADLGIGVLDAWVEACAYVTECSLNEREARPALFFSVLESRRKADDLLCAIRATPPDAVLRPLHIFRDLPDEVMCFWLSPRLLDFVRRTRPARETGVEAIQGMQTGDDFRFYRLHWEVPVTAIGKDIRWVPVTKGGEYSPFFDDIHLLADWAKDGSKIKSYVIQQYPYLNGDWGWVVKNSQAYFQSGLTYPERTVSDFSPRIMPEGVIFTAVGMAIIGETQERTLGYLAGSYTRLFKALLDAFVGSGDSSMGGSAAKHIRAGLLNALPHPLPTPSVETLTRTRQAIESRRYWNSQHESCGYFVRPGWLMPGSSLREAYRGYLARQLDDSLRILEDNRHVEVEQAGQFGMSLDLLENDLKDVGPHPMSYPSREVNDSTCAEVATLSEEQLIQRCVETRGARRQITKKSFIADRRLELAAHLMGVNPHSIARSAGYLDGRVESEIGVVGGQLVQFLLGCAFGRWNVELSNGRTPAPQLGEPFAELPVFAPGMLQSPDNDVNPFRYPLEIPSEGVLFDNPGGALDIETGLHRVMEVIWNDRAEAIDREVCDVLGVGGLREYFRRPSGFFADHLKWYSKSRRKAPIYWPLSTSSGSYTAWVYYHRLTADTLFRIAKDHLEPKLRQVQESRLKLDAEVSKEGGRGLAKLVKEAAELTELEQELQEFRAELLRVAALPYKPDLNDGVEITAAPLWRVFRYTPWRKELEDTWKKLERSEYEWSRMAYTIYPQRVREKCRTDRSLGISHGLEKLYEGVEEPVRPARKNKTGRSRIRVAEPN